jgi:hypothetical protein
MSIDYTEAFNSPDELADFLMLPQEQQLDALRKKASGIQNLVLACELKANERACHE